MLERIVTIAAVGACALGATCHAATLFETTALVAATPDAARQLPETIEFTVPTPGGNYTVTLRDESVLPATLDSLRAIVTHDLGVVAEVEVQYPQGQVPTPATDSFAAAPGTYRIHVLGSTPAGEGGGTFRVTVAPAAGGTALVDEIDAIAPNPTAPAGTSTFRATFEITAAGSYQLTLGDHAFPAALANPPDVFLARGTTPVFTQVDFTGTAAITVPTPGAHELIIFATAASPQLAGLYTVALSGGPSSAVVHRSTNAVGALPPPTAVQFGAAGGHALALADLELPVPLTSMQAALVQNGVLLGTRIGAGSTPINAAQGPAALFAVATATTVGALGVRVSQGAQTVHADVVLVDASPGPATPSIYAFRHPQQIAAGQYRFTLRDFRFPRALPALEAAIMQGDLVVDRLDAASVRDVTLQAGRVTALVVAEPPGTPAAPESGLFGVDLSLAAGANVFESTQGVGGLFRPQTVQVATDGRYAFTLTDLQFPRRLEQGMLAITRRTQLVGEVFGGGTISSQQLPAGLYVLNFIGQPEAGAQYGGYGLKVADAPAAPTVTISASPASITSGQTTTLQWSATNATTCTASNAWSGTKGMSGTEPTGTLNATATFELVCTGLGGSASASTTVTVSPPSVNRSGGGSVGAAAVLALVLLLYWTRRSSMIQFVAQVLPPSDDDACSQRADVGVMCDQMKRPRTGLPSTS